MRIKPWLMGLIIVVFIFGGVGFTKVLELWVTTSSKIPASYQEGEFAGSYNPADIRGSYTFGEISELFDIPLGDISAAFDLEDNNKAYSMQVKELETRYQLLKTAGQEIGTNSVRIFTAFYNGQPFSLDEDVFLLQPALEVLKTKSKITPEQLSYLIDHLADPEKEVFSADTGVESNKIEEAGRTIKGNTTFAELIGWGMTPEEIETVIGKKIPSSLMTVRDFCIDEGIEFSVVKGALQKSL